MTNWIGAINGIVKLCNAVLVYAGMRKKAQQEQDIKSDPRGAVHQHFSGVMPESGAGTDLPTKPTNDRPGRR